jgi:hypothetical protein
MARPEKEQTMIKLDQVKVTLCDQQVLNLLVEGCSNKKIAGPLDISLRTVKQHLRTLFLRAGIREGRKRGEVGHRYCSPRRKRSDNPRAPHPEGTQISVLVWEGLTDREIGKIVGTGEPVIKNHSCAARWTDLASGAGLNWRCR